MGFQVDVFLSSRASFPPHFLKIVVEVKTLVGGKQWHAPCKMRSLQQSFFVVSVEFHGDHKTVTMLR